MMSYKKVEEPVISIQCNWNEVLRNAKGEFWVSCKYRGQNSLQGKVTIKGVPRAEPLLSPSDGFEVQDVSRNTISIKHVPSNNICVFIAPVQSYSGIHDKSVVSSDVSSSGLCVSASTDNKLHVWDVNSGIIRRSLEGHVGNVYKCQFFPSGVVVLSGGADMQLKIWSAETGQCPATLSGHTAAITDFCIVEKGRNVISVSKDGVAKLWDCGRSSCLADLISHDSAINCCSLTVTNDKIEIGEPEVKCSDREISTQDKLLIVGCEDGTIMIIAVWSRKKIKWHILDSAINCVTSFCDKYLVGCQNGKILMYKMDAERTQPLICWFDSNSTVLSILNYKDNGVFAGRADGSCTFYETKGYKEQRVQLTGPDWDPVYDIAFDGSAVYTASRDSIIRKYDVEKVLQSTFQF